MPKYRPPIEFVAAVDKALDAWRPGARTIRDQPERPGMPDGVRIDVTEHEREFALV